MTDEPSARDTKRQAKADAAADKARAKAERPWWKKKRIMVPLALVALIALFGVLGGDEAADVVTDDPDTASDVDDAPDEAPAEAEHARIGEQAADGQFTFTVNELDCGATELETEFGEPEQAGGQWCVLNLTVENTGNEARSLSASDQYLYDDADRRFSAEMPLGVDTPIYEQLNPGLSMQGALYFDVPTDFNPAFAELHDSAFSDGVLVDLS